MSDNRESEWAKEIRFETFTPGGPGGQHANKTSSAVRAVHAPTGVSAVAREHRSQHRNRELALERLLGKLRARHRPARPRISTRIPPQAVAQRRQSKEHRSRLKVARKKVFDE
jgi:protein subunit release factor B